MPESSVPSPVPSPVPPPMPPHAVLAALRERAIDDLLDREPLLVELGGLFAARGREIALVGGPVRDAIRGVPGTDLDLTTSAQPEEILEIVKAWADAVWDVGIRFGTIGARKGDREFEITTYRSDIYSPDSRKPQVQFGDNLEGDLHRRDFTINSMAVRLPSREFVDPYGGLADLAVGLIRTPGTPEVSFGDDPLRMMRAARFVSQLGMRVDPDLVAAMRNMRERIEIISAERVRDELSKLLLGGDPKLGLALMVESGLADHVLPELPALRLEIDEHHRHKDVYEHSLMVLSQAIDLEQSHEPNIEPDLTLRLAALLHDIGKPRTRRFESDGRVSFHHHEVVGAKMVSKRLKALRFSNEIVDDVTKLVALHLRFHGYSSGEWTDSAVRRYVRDAGDQLVRLHKLTRADCTTRNVRKANALRRSYDDVERRIERLAEEEEIAAIRPDLDGRQIMEILGIPPGREVGQAYNWLLERRLDRGPVAAEVAEAELREWWAGQQR